MNFVIFCIDKPGISRDPSIMKAHVEYLADNPIKIIMSGPLTDDNGDKVIGSLYLVEAENRDEVDTFREKDPLVHADYWELVEVRAFDKRVDNRD